MSATDVEAALQRGASMVEERDTRATDVLEAAAKASRALLVQAGGTRLLTAGPESMPSNGPLHEATWRAARAHLAWGQAADRFAKRDQAIIALARAYRFAGPSRGGNNPVSREASIALGAALREGLPHFAEDDTLDTLASLSLWKPRRFSFDFPAGALGPSLTSAGASTSQASPSSATPRVELMITQGKVFPPESMTMGSDKNVVAPLYRAVAADALPPVLRLGYMVAGFEKLTSGANAGQWELKARVFYPHPIFTRGNRDDRPRAEALCAQFLRLRALQQIALGLGNPYERQQVQWGASSRPTGGTGDMVTSLWLNEVSALWPADDDDPETADFRGARMPKVNTQSPVVRPAEIAETPLSMPWLAAAQIDSAPGDILFFKSGQPRSEAEWLREVAHEYGHVALAPVGLFRPPLEPFGNGELGETLAMLWAAASPASFDASAFAPLGGVSPTAAGFTPLPDPPAPRSAKRPASANAENSSEPASPDNTPAGIRAAALAQVAREAVPAMRLWNAQGPLSALRRDGTVNGLKYLQGFCVWAERVYGAPWLGAAMRPSIERSASSWNSNARIVPTPPGTLISDWERAMLLSLKGGGRLALWLPGTLENLPQSVPATQVVNRAPLSLKAGQSIATRLLIPLDARVLHLDLRSPGANGASVAAAANALSIAGWKARPAAGGIEISLEKRNGWQRFVWTAKAPVTIGGAWLSR
jgi:hypothetical protein